MGGRGSASGFIKQIPNANDALIPDKKITNYLLDSSKTHYAEFIAVGYSENNPEQLKRDILEGLKNNTAKEYAPNSYGHKAYEVDMILGITTRRTFRTVWQIDKGKTNPRFITAHRIGRNRK